MLVPSSNTVVEPEVALLSCGLPGVSIHVSRIEVKRIGLDAESCAQFDPVAMRRAALLLADTQPDVIVWAGTSGSWLGADHDRGVVEAIENAANVRATTSTLAVFEVCRAFGIESVSLLTPYTDDVTDRIVDRINREGINVAGRKNLGLTDNRSFADVNQENIRTSAMAACKADFQALLILCTNLPAMPCITELEAALDRPVFDSVVASLWGAFQLLDKPVFLEDAGRLFSEGSFRMALRNITDTLLRTCSADRVTIRIDLYKYRMDVDITAGESVGLGIRRIGEDRSIDQRGLATINWLEENRTLLNQPSFESPPFPPDELRNTYGVQAQLLGPIVVDETMLGWVSVHSKAERLWSDWDQVQVRSAIAQVGALIEL